MKKSITTSLIALMSLVAAACTKANLAAVSAYGTQAEVLKYSGGKLVYAGISEGKVENEDHSDGYYFADKCENGRQVSVSGDVVIVHLARGETMECNVLPKLASPTLG